MVTLLRYNFLMTRTHKENPQERPQGVGLISLCAHVQPTSVIILCNLIVYMMLMVVVAMCVYVCMCVCMY